MRTPSFCVRAITFAVVVLFGGVCRDAAAESYRVVTTVGMITDVVSRVAGERAEVVGLIGSGVDPHLYKPTRSDIVTLGSGKIVFYNGLLLEGKMTDALIRTAGSGSKVVAVTESLDPALLLEPAEFQGHYDPHVWMDPSIWSQTVAVVEKTLAGFDSSAAENYRKRSEATRAEIVELDRRCEAALKTVPNATRVLVTAHDAFNYFGRRYGFEVVGIQGISTESEAGVRDIERIVELLVSRKVPAVFVESTVSERNIRALVEGAHARGHSVNIGGQLFSDAMGKPGTYEGTYVGMIDHNVTTIVRALGGTVSPRGLFDRLTE